MRRSLNTKLYDFMLLIFISRVKRGRELIASGVPEKACLLFGVLCNLSVLSLLTHFSFPRRPLNSTAAGAAHHLMVIKVILHSLNYLIIFMSFASH